MPPPSGVVEIYSQQVTSPHRGAWARISEAPPVYSNRPWREEQKDELKDQQRPKKKQRETPARPKSTAAAAAASSPLRLVSPPPMRISSHLPQSPYPEPHYREPATDDDCEENNLLRLRIFELEERIASETRIKDSCAPQGGVGQQRANGALPVAPENREPHKERNAPYNVACAGQLSAHGADDGLRAPHGFPVSGHR